LLAIYTDMAKRGNPGLDGRIAALKRSIAAAAAAGLAKQAHEAMTSAHQEPEPPLDTSAPQNVV
jgi:hypothetical protein